jgi:hypothetical protein
MLLVYVHEKLMCISTSESWIVFTHLNNDYTI